MGQNEPTVFTCGEPFDVAMVVLIVSLILSRGCVSRTRHTNIRFRATLAGAGLAGETAVLAFRDSPFRNRSMPIPRAFFCMFFGALAVADPAAASNAGTADFTM